MGSGMGKRPSATAHPDLSASALLAVLPLTPLPTRAPKSSSLMQALSNCFDMG